MQNRDDSNIQWNGWDKKRGAGKSFPRNQSISGIIAKNNTKNLTEWETKSINWKAVSILGIKWYGKGGNNSY